MSSRSASAMQCLSDLRMPRPHMAEGPRAPLLRFFGAVEAATDQRLAGHLIACSCFPKAELDQFVVFHNALNDGDLITGSKGRRGVHIDSRNLRMADEVKQITIEDILSDYHREILSQLPSSSTRLFGFGWEIAALPSLLCRTKKSLSEPRFP
jgi:hypothetical protein